MEEFAHISGLRKALEQRRAERATVGFVATMGALHEGHLSLVRRAVAECDVVVMSIFLNPLQFGVREDLDKYPRPIAQDRVLAEGAGVTYLFAPGVDEMYAGGALLTTVNVRDITRTMEGALRPELFSGVATVVAKLFSIVGPCRAYFGEKDWQQLAVVTRMAADLSMPVQVIGCETIRDADGLALSSRNAYFSPEELQAAYSLSRALSGAQELVKQGERSVATLSNYMMDVMNKEELVIVVNYAEAVDANFKLIEEVTAGSRLLVSTNIAGTSLIDNMAAFPVIPDKPSGADPGTSALGVQS